MIPVKVTKWDKISMEGCTFRLIAGTGIALLEFWHWFSNFLVVPMHPKKSNFIFKNYPYIWPTGLTASKAPLCTNE